MTDAKTLAYINLFAILGAIPYLCRLDAEAAALIEGETVSIGFAVKDGPEATLFNGGGKQGFLCIEPQAGWVNGLNIPSAHKVLGAGKSAQYEITIGKVCAG